MTAMREYAPNKSDLWALCLFIYFEWKENLPEVTVSWAMVDDSAVWSGQ